MKRKLFNPIALACCFIVFAAFVVADLSGKWTGVIKTPDGNDLQVSYNFKVDGDKLTGTAESPAGTVTVDDGKVNGDTFTFKVTVDGNDYPHSGKIYADSCALDIDFGAQKVHTTLKRAPADK
jgi:myo-inositol-hexaphosphate 3-phosphohydrolase